MHASVIVKSAARPMEADLAAQHDRGVTMRLQEVAVDNAEFPMHANPFFKVAVIVQAPKLHAHWISASGRAAHKRIEAGTCSIMPAEMDYRTCWSGGGSMLLLSFSPEFMAARDASLSAQQAELRPSWAQRDPFLVQLAQSVRLARRAGLASDSYLHCVGEVAMVHLLTSYGGGRGAPLMPLQSLALARVLDRIETDLEHELPLAVLAAEAGLSLYGFARAFTKAVGVPPHRYVLQRRCSRAKELLAHSTMPLADIALAVGFSSQAHLTTVMVRISGMTPARYRSVATR